MRSYASAAGAIYSPVMSVGVWNLVMGLLAIGAAVGGMHFPMLGQYGNTALYVLGGVLAVLGISQIVRSRRVS
jgi:hypothetical protein